VDSSALFIESVMEEEKGKQPWTLREFGGKTLWDWMGLLIVPVVLSIITVGFTWQQNERQQDLETERSNQAQKIENQRAAAERELAEQRAQDAALQAYLDQTGTLLLEENLHDSKKTVSEVRTLARARTLTVLQRLDASRKAQVINFLAEANLIDKEAPNPPVISLQDANLEGVKLEGSMYLASIDLAGADLSGADLSGVDLIGAWLFGADLSGIDLSCDSYFGRCFDPADLSDADLFDADLRNANLKDAVLTQAQLEEARSLEGATMPDGQILKSDVNPDGPTFEEWRKSKDSGEDGEKE
jgi:uncharacterized protein YjbI with pentapeptide repeats